jgi:hypothetical protein
MGINGGYIRLSRKFFKNKYWLKERTYSQAEAWLDLIQMARFEAEPADIILASGRRITIKRGEIRASLRFLSDRWSWGMNLEKTKKFIDYHIAENEIERRTEQGESILKLCNYDSYNELDYETVTPTVTPTVTKNNKEKKENKENNNKSPYGDMSGAARPPSRPDEFLNYISQFNAVRSTQYRGDSKARRQFNARIKEHITIAQMMEALKNAMRDAYHTETGYRYLTPEFFTRPDKIDRFLNAPSGNGVSSGDDFKNRMANFISQKTNQKNK